MLLHNLHTHNKYPLRTKTYNNARAQENEEEEDEEEKNTRCQVKWNVEANTERTNEIWNEANKNLEDANNVGKARATSDEQMLLLLGFNFQYSSVQNSTAKTSACS